MPPRAGIVAGTQADECGREQGARVWLAGQYGAGDLAGEMRGNILELSEERGRADQEALDRGEIAAPLVRSRLDAKVSIVLREPRREGLEAVVEPVADGEACRIG